MKGIGRRIMIVLKWLLIAGLLLYGGGLAFLFFQQRSMLFPIPPVGRMAPEAAGFPEAEEQVLTAADGEKVIIWHVPAKPGHPVVLFYPGNGDFLAGRVSRSGWLGTFHDPVSEVVPALQHFRDQLVEFVPAEPVADILKRKEPLSPVELRTTALPRLQN